MPDPLACPPGLMQERLAPGSRSLGSCYHNVAGADELRTEEKRAVAYRLKLNAAHGGCGTGFRGDGVPYLPENRFGGNDGGPSAYDMCAKAGGSQILREQADPSEAGPIIPRAHSARAG
jgi:hypothetical protein